MSSNIRRRNRLFAKRIAAARAEAAAMVHVDHWLDAPPIDGTDGISAAREFLEFSRLPAWNKFSRDEPAFFVTCEYRGTRYWLAGASRMGDVWLRRSRPFSAIGNYDLRVNVAECSGWTREPRT